MDNLPILVMEFRGLNLRLQQTKFPGKNQNRATQRGAQVKMTKI